MKDFAAIDFETANEHRSSVCSVGVVIVRDGHIVDKTYRLIRPNPNFYRYWNTYVHGLSSSDTDHAPVFPDVWKEISPRFAGLPLVAHNSPFDEGCLKAVFQSYGMDYPDYEFHCTCRAARHIFGKSLPDHKLPTVAARCGFDLLRQSHWQSSKTLIPRKNNFRRRLGKANRASSLLFSRLALYLDNTGGASEKQIEQALCFSLLALYLDNTGGASEKQIEQALCFSLGLHYIWIIQAAPRKSKSSKLFAFLSACTIFAIEKSF